MTLPDFEELTRYWADHPPLHILLGAYLRSSKQQGRAIAPSLNGLKKITGSAPEEVLAELGPGFRAGDVHAGLKPVSLDLAELRRQTEDH